MSFSNELKNSIIASTYKVCCRKNLLMGVLFSKAACDGENLSLTIEKEDTAIFISKLIKEFYTELPLINRLDKGGRCFSLSFKSKSAAKYISNIENSEYYLAKCDMCQSAFLKGVYLASGRLSDPAKQYSLDFSLADRCEMFSAHLDSLGIRSGISQKRSERIVYVKACDEIEEFCAFAGLNKGLFALIDARAEGEIRKNVMRVANCETNNIAKTVDAARGQLEVIRALDEANLLSSLPDELEATARLRLQYSDLSLSQLAAVSVPPISKPGLSHRLKRIIEIGNNLLMRK